MKHATIQEKRVLLNHIANLEHQLFQIKLRLNEPLSKLESVTKKLDPLPKEFRHQQVNNICYCQFYTNTADTLISYAIIIMTNYGITSSRPIRKERENYVNCFFFVATTLGKQGNHFECTKTSGSCSISWRNGNSY